MEVESTNAYALYYVIDDINSILRTQERATKKSKSKLSSVGTCLRVYCNRVIKIHGHDCTPGFPLSAYGFILQAPLAYVSKPTTYDASECRVFMIANIVVNIMAR